MKYYEILLENQLNLHAGIANYNSANTFWIHKVNRDLTLQPCLRAKNPSFQGVYGYTVQLFNCSKITKLALPLHFKCRWTSEGFRYRDNHFHLFSALMNCCSKNNINNIFFMNMLFIQSCKSQVYTKLLTDFRQECPNTVKCKIQGH